VWHRLRARVSRRFVAGVCVVAVISAYALGWHFGRGGRGFFSPDTLDSRSQSEILLPLTRLPLYRSWFHYDRAPLVDYLVGKGYWSPRQAPPTKWIGTFN
jgi:hypothetical protein